MKFDPIAIIGQSCVLPGALSPDSLWDAVVNGRDLTSRVGPNEWGIPTASVLDGEFGNGEQSFCDIGGYVRGFESVFDPAGFRLKREVVENLDTANQWLLHAGRSALESASVEDTSHTGAVIGNLSFPTRAMADYSARKWLGAELADLVGLPEVSAKSRFMSGLPADILAEGLGLGEQAYAIDAACASSLYAIKLACDQLHDGNARTMLAGAVCASDDLFLHVGFSSLSALSKRGQSRPFDSQADGLIPASGAGFVVLKLLRDALEDGDSVLGVIRGVGLSNDGRSGGFLAPAKEGQIRALQSAYDMAELHPSQISLLECHATGTQVGDATEVQSCSEIFQGMSGLPIGSLKSNVGHLITVAGVAGLIKVLQAFRHGVRPPSINVQDEIGVLRDSPFRVLKEAESWESEGLKRAGISAFGFGGNNAHLIVEEFDAETHQLLVEKVKPTFKNDSEIGIVGVGGIIGNASSIHAFAEGLQTPAALCSPEAQELALEITSLRFPPVDVKAALPQQTYLLQAAIEAVSNLPTLNHDRCGVFVGMGCDTRVARYGLRWRLWEWAKRVPHLNRAKVEQLQDKIAPALTSAGVLGTMPNIVANRLNAQFDFQGMSFSVSAEERSGLRALQLALRALRSGELDVAIVGAVDFGKDELHQEALKELGIRRVNGDGAVVLVLQREKEATASQNPILATVDECIEVNSLLNVSELEDRFGHSHAAFGLIALLSKALSFRESKAQNETIVSIASLGGVSDAVSIKPHWSSEKFSLGPISLGQGPHLRMPAHGSKLSSGDFSAERPITRSPKKSRQQFVEVSEMSVQGHGGSTNSNTMEAAPWLPAVAQEHIPQDFAGGSQGIISRENSLPERSPENRVMSIPASPRKMPLGFSDMLHSHVARITSVHRQFIEQQNEIQNQFLEMRRKGAALFFQNQGAMPATRKIETIIQPAKPAAPQPKIEAKPKPLTPQPKAILREVKTELSVPETPKAEVFVQPRSPVLPGPKWSREELMVHAGGQISEIYGDEFKGQEHYERQVRMPLPPLLLADRVTGLKAEPKSMKTGTIWTETDVTQDAWYLHEGHIPAGVMIEAGQADLMLISYLGIDFLNQGDRVYRLLGCELTYYSHLPKVGETLQFEIHADGHAKQGDIRLFFFHYDCRVDGEPRLSVRQGQAGFFSDEELADSMGILWDPAEATPCENPRLSPPKVEKVPTTLSRTQLDAFAAGKLFECFGQGFEYGCTHTRTPTISGGRMLFLDEVTELTTTGGPWGRGYLRATDAIEPDDWFFDGHFKNDPCMPGTLMFEGCLQTMAIYMAGLGMTLDLDGWRFEPVPEEAFELRCRGQVRPNSKEVVYEVFVEEVIDGPYPTLYADLLCTVDGLKAFHCKRMGLRLVPAWPLEQKLLEMGWSESERPAAIVGEHIFNHRSLLACAWGKPSEAFGPIYDVFDSPRRVARLPGPPYHFMSRITEINGTIGEFSPGDSVEVEFDIPQDAWYFRENGAETMPHCVLLEAALQPCGWLASFVGSALGTEQDLFFRNLDGKGVLKKELIPASGRLITRASITDKSSFGGMVIETFKVECLIDDEVVYEMDTNFGFFPKEALAAQAGLPVPENEKGILEKESSFFVDLKARPEKYCSHSLSLPTPFLTMIDRITGYWPEDGEFGLGRFRSEQDVNVDAWYFKAHFFQDPVQPGSLGIEAMIQVLQFAMMEMGLGEGMTSPRFEPIGLGTELTWKYRGQVRPWNDKVSVVLDIQESGSDSKGAFAIAKASLWADGMRIYSASNLGMRIVDAETTVEIIDPESDPWLKDHCPTWTVPVLPMMSMVDRIASAAAKVVPSECLKGLTNVQVSRWLPVDRATAIESECNVEGDGLHVSLFNEEGPIASGTVRFGSTWEQAPEPTPAMTGSPVDNPYESGILFHGPAFQLLRTLQMGEDGSSSILDASAPLIPHGVLNQGLLDAATHGIPHDRLDLWCSELDASEVAYPALITEMELFGETPQTGAVRCEVRFDGFFGSKRFPAFKIELIHNERVWAQLRLVEALFPKGPLGQAKPEDRRAFLKDRIYVPGVCLSQWDGEKSLLSVEAVNQSDWLDGTLPEIYDIQEGGDSLVKQIAIKEHLAQKVGLHPARIAQGLPLTQWKIDAIEDERGVVVNGVEESLNLAPIKSYWTNYFNRGRWPVEDIYYGLIERFVRRVVIEDPKKWEAIKGRGVLYLANHQVGVESLLFSVIVSGLIGQPTVTLAKAEHRDTWLGDLIRHNFSYPGVTDPRLITYFDREDQASLPTIIAELAEEMQQEGRGVMVHVEGTRSLNCTTPVEKMSGAFVDMAMSVGAPIVPVRFMGGLPCESLKERIEFPLGMGKQDYWLGTPILPEELEGLPYKERKAKVLAAINGLGMESTAEKPITGDDAFAAEVVQWTKASGVTHEHATLLKVLQAEDDLCSETREILSAASFDGRDAATQKWLGQLTHWLLGDTRTSV